MAPSSPAIGSTISDRPIPLPTTTFKSLHLVPCPTQSTNTTQRITISGTRDKRKWTIITLTIIASLTWISVFFHGPTRRFSVHPRDFLPDGLEAYNPIAGSSVAEQNKDINLIHRDHRGILEDPTSRRDGLEFEDRRHQRKWLSVKGMEVEDELVFARDVMDDRSLDVEEFVRGVKGE